MVHPVTIQPKTIPPRDHSEAALFFLLWQSSVTDGQGHPSRVDTNGKVENKGDNDVVVESCVSNHKEPADRVERGVREGRRGEESWWGVKGRGVLEEERVVHGRGNDG